MAIIHSLKCTMPFSFVVRLLSLPVTNCHLLSLAVTRCTTRCHSLSLVVIRCHWLYHSLSFVVTRCHSLSPVVPLVVSGCHSLSFVITRCTTRYHSLYHSLLLVVSLVVTRCCHSLSLDLPLVCLFINDPLKQ